MSISRKALERRLSAELLKADNDEWLAGIRILPGGVVNGTVVSRVFENVDAADRRVHIERVLRAIDTILRPGFLSLYTPEEADALELEHAHAARDAPSDPAGTWLELASALAQAEARSPQAEPMTSPRVVAFYSYKGGVGRTTAITHTAYELARSGKKVVLVDLDLEAPGLNDVFDLPKSPPVGILEFLYRSRPGMAEEQVPAITDTFCEVRFRSEARGRLFVVPAGKVDSAYIARIASLRVEDILGPNGPWDRFVKQINEQLEPDYVLIDSRTGINDWAAFCLFHAAHEVFVVFFPSRQNVDGLRPLLDGMRLLGLGDRVRLWASMYPARKEGESRAKEYLAELGRVLSTDQSRDETENIYEPGTTSDDDQLLGIPYLEAVALADEIPVIAARTYYSQLVNRIDEMLEEASLVRILDHQGARREILESLPFDVVTAEEMNQERLKKLFHRTSDFDKLLDGPTCLVRGRKGTGKSVLYGIFVKHQDMVKELASPRLDDKRYDFVSGHGEASPKPGPDEFGAWHRLVTERKLTWHALWRAIVLLRLVPLMERKPKEMSDEVWRTARKPTTNAPSRWTREHTRAVEELAVNATDSKYALDALDDAMTRAHREVWLFFDDLDEDFQTDAALRNKALSGLFELLQTSDDQHHKAIRFKVLLREDIWNELTFQNKSHFNGRYIELRWRRTDVLRLALKQALASPRFDDIARKFKPISNLELASEESLVNALEPLWGVRMGKKRSKYVHRWVYERLSDSQGNFFPRAMQHLLIAAKEKELEYLARQGIQAPRDRLIRVDALLQGLKEKASKERVEELKEEYKEIRSFLDSLRELGTSPLANKAIQERWDRCGRPRGIPTKDAITWLQSIGLMSDASRSGEQKIADLYLYGLGLSRMGQ
ncbi:AAA family ATPase [Sorangium sp. So ce291]|uniref:AAA family ATPase n=1 Tax=Sorangium sp. So ce291 TaxID=3133294 RepID=UPI003F644E20